MVHVNTSSSVFRYLRVVRKGADSAVGLLLEFPFSIAIDSEHYWLRYPADSEKCRHAATTIPCEHFYSESGDLLIRDGETVASARLPTLTWTPLKDFVQLILPKAGLAGRLQTKQLGVWELQRSSHERAVEAALYELEPLAAWLKGASNARTTPLRFCLARFGQVNTANEPSEAPLLVFIIGTPLPPVNCIFLCRDERIFTPAGFQWEPNLDTTLVAQSFGLQTKQWLLWTTDYGWTTIFDDQCVPLSRATLRATLREGSSSS